MKDVVIAIDGEWKTVDNVVPILFFMNDAKEGDMFTLCVHGHSCGTKQHSCTCNIEFEDMFDVYHEYQFIYSGGVEALVDAYDTDGSQAMAQYCICSCFCGLEFCQPKFGIFGAQPDDMLHMILLGLFKDGMIVFYKCFTDSQLFILDAKAQRFNKYLQQTHHSIFPKTDFTKQGYCQHCAKTGKGINRYIVCVVCIDAHQ